MAEDTVGRLGAAINGSDVDLKVAALTNLQQELTQLEPGQPLELVHDIIGHLKVAYRAANSQVSLAALTCIPTLVPLISSPTYMLQLVKLLGPPNSILDRLGDRHDNIRDMAMQTVMSIAKGALQHSPTRSSDSPWSIFEEFFRTNGLSNKTSKVKQQCLHCFCELRSVAPNQISIRPQLPTLIELLEDADSGVRSTSRETIITIFSSDSITSAARADLKKELTARNIRKPTADAILTHVFSSQPPPPMRRNSSLLSPQQTPSRPTSRLSRPGSSLSGSVTPLKRVSSLAPSTSTSSLNEVAISKYFVASSRDLETDFAKMHAGFEGKESEHNWLMREENIKKIREMINAQVHLDYPEVFILSLKSVLDGILKSLASLRTVLASSTISLISELALALGTNIDPLYEQLITPLMGMAGQTKKIVASTSQEAARNLIASAPYHTKTLQLINNAINDKSAQTRSYAVAHLTTVVDTHLPHNLHLFESHGGIEWINKILTKAIEDPASPVKDPARVLYWKLYDTFPVMLDNLMQNLDPQQQKGLHRSNPNGTLPTSTLQNKPSVKDIIKQRRNGANQLFTSMPARRVSSSAPQRSKSTTPPPVPSIPQSSVARKRLSMISPPIASPSVKVTSTPPARARPASMYSDFSPQTTPSRIQPKPRTSSASVDIKSPPNFKTTTTTPRTAPALLRTKNVKTTPSNTGHSHIPVRSSRSPSISSVGSMRHVSMQTNARSPSTSGFPLSPNESRHGYFAPRSTSERSSSDIHRTPSKSPRAGAMAPSYSSRQNDRNNLSAADISDDELAEDAMRAQAEHAEIAAERLLELVEPDGLDDSDSDTAMPIPPIGPGGIRNIDSKPIPIARPMLSFQSKIDMNTVSDSPGDAVGKTRDMGKSGMVKDTWWILRANVLSRGPDVLEDSDSQRSLILEATDILKEDQIPNITSILQASQVSSKRPCEYADTEQESSERQYDSEQVSKWKANEEFWSTAHLFDNLLTNLLQFLSRKEGISEDFREMGLLLLRDILVHQLLLISGRELEIVNLLLDLRSSTSKNINAGSEALIATFVDLVDPLYGLSCLRSALERLNPKSTHVDNSNGKDSSSDVLSTNNDTDDHVKSRALALRAIGSFFERIPSEVVEEELQKAKMSIQIAFNDTRYAELRQAAVSSLVAAQSVINDEEKVFDCVGPFSKSQKALLTYYFTK